jgi:hypothetical protein
MRVNPSGWPRHCKKKHPQEIVANLFEVHTGAISIAGMALLLGVPGMARGMTVPLKRPWWPDEDLGVQVPCGP